ncbi:hypothetical protein KI387_038265, partial [Taxus chinensis]
MRMEAQQQTEILQHQWKTWHDAHIKKWIFHEGQWVLLFDSRYQQFKGKLHTCWLGPYQVNQVFDNGSVRLIPIDGDKQTLL